MKGWLRNTLLIDGVQRYIYGDRDYEILPWLQTDYLRSLATVEQIVYITKMNADRTAMECNYKDIKQSFLLMNLNGAQSVYWYALDGNHLIEKLQNFFMSFNASRSCIFLYYRLASLKINGVLRGGAP